ncbi:uracil-DNA glycosylase [Treponema pectinovorum]|uniref:uracil-DNA glycosylase n=1 Tax=Treponema pectinovorum TaxID=164 RepID=UPI0011C7E13D|nr:uracil-DNA glycosylase [Treponema pectinovorum]
MTAQEKTQIYTLLKVASDSINGYRSSAFPEGMPQFTDDADFASQKNFTKIFAEQTTELSNSFDCTQKEKSNLSSSSIENVIERIKNCKSCALSKTRHNTVPGTGVLNPLVLVIGEGPGYEEDMQALPFVGPAGQLLDRMLAAIKLSRCSNSYIANIVKCRPPQNRNPYSEEADACISFLHEQIEILKPKAILCAGTVAAKNLLKTGFGVTRLRGRFYEYSNIPVAVTYHPSALLRDENLKRDAWQDLKMFRQKLLEINPNYESSYIPYVK